MFRQKTFKTHFLLQVCRASAFLLILLMGGCLLLFLFGGRFATSQERERIVAIEGKGLQIQNGAALGA